MIPGRQPIYKPAYYLQRPQSPKNNLGQAQSAKNLSLTMSIGANQSPSNFIGFPKSKQEQPQQPQSDTTLPGPADKWEKMEAEMRSISKENVNLKEENEFLKKELMKLKRENIAENVRSAEKYPNMSPDAYNDLRGTIKKETGEIRELKLKLDMVSKQCKMYEEIIEKLEERIKKLLQDQHKKSMEIDELRQELSRIDSLKEKTNSLMRLYNDLESKFNADQLEWMKWKQNWMSEKQYYLSIIHQLESNSQRYFS